MANNKNAALAATTALSTPPSNEDAMREAFFDRCSDWGTKAGAGATSKVGWILDIAATAWDPNSPIGKGDKAAKRAEATTAYEKYRLARQQKAGEMGKRLAGDDDRSRVNRISEVVKYIEVGALPLIHDADMGGYGTLKRTQKIILQRDDIKGEVEDLLSKVATKQKGSPDKNLTDDEIVEVLCPPEKDRPSDEEAEAALWANVRTQCDSIMKKYPDSAGASPDAKTARACADKRVRDLGGTRTERLKLEAAAEKERKKQVRIANVKTKKGRK